MGGVDRLQKPGAPCQQMGFLWWFRHVFREDSSGIARILRQWLCNARLDHAAMVDFRLVEVVLGDNLCVLGLPTSGCLLLPTIRIFMSALGP